MLCRQYATRKAARGSQSIYAIVLCRFPSLPTVDHTHKHKSGLIEGNQAPPSSQHPLRLQCVYCLSQQGSGCNGKALPVVLLRLQPITMAGARMVLVESSQSVLEGMVGICQCFLGGGGGVWWIGVPAFSCTWMELTWPYQELPDMDWIFR